MAENFMKRGLPANDVLLAPVGKNSLQGMFRAKGRRMAHFIAVRVWAFSRGFFTQTKKTVAVSTRGLFAINFFGAQSRFWRAT
jgi:hypothetical protein